MLIYHPRKHIHEGIMVISPIICVCPGKDSHCQRCMDIIKELDLVSMLHYKVPDI
jgi:hypothetical protein